MVDYLLKQIQKYTPTSPALAAALQEAIVVKTYEKEEKVLQAGQVCRYFYFLHTGLVRSYYYHDGKDKTYWFYEQSQFFTSWYSFHYQQESYDNLEALEPTQLGLLTYSDYQQLAKTYADFGFFARTLAELECALGDYYHKRYSDISAKEKYQHLLADIPNIATRVKLGHLASFLGISQETLSRIRASRD